MDKNWKLQGRQNIYDFWLKGKIGQVINEKKENDRTKNGALGDTAGDLI